MSNAVRYSKTFFVVSFVFILYLFVLILKPFFTSLVFAVILGTLFFGTYEKLRTKLGERSSLAAAIMCVIITFLIILPLVVLLFIVAQQIVDTYQAVQGDLQNSLLQFRSGEGPVGKAVERLGKTLGMGGVEIRAQIKEIIQSVGAFLASKSLAVLGGFAGLVMNFFITIFTLFFLFRDGKRLTHEIKACIPMAPEYKERIVEKFIEVTRATFVSAYVTGLAQGVLAGLIYWALGVPHPILWAATTAVFSLVPVIGTAAVWVPIALFLLVTGHTIRALLLVGAGGLIVGMVDNVVRPLVIRGTSKGMHVLLIFFGVLGGIGVFGFSGLVLGPVVVALVLTFMDFYKKEFQEELRLK